jgi:diaminohydroxyphosphoribosylaminopyrimidine deaminase/5-amino-6-(5-phosphoribosylamino)uracil reductase
MKSSAIRPGEKHQGDKDDASYMRKALALAKKGEGLTSPNPLVGALVVKDGEIAGNGFHRKAGGPHAEVFALDRAAERARGSTLYVSLEPCCYYGRTPPCTKKIIECGVRRVVIAAGDPNPLVRGKGIEELRNAGIEVGCGLLEKEARIINEVFFK